MGTLSPFYLNQVEAIEKGRSLLMGTLMLYPYTLS